MGIFERIAMLVKSNINDLIDRAEDPEKMAKQVIVELEEALEEAKSGVAAAIAEEKRLKALMEEHKYESEKWQERAEKAVLKGDDELAKEALRRKKSHDQDLAHFTELYERQQKQVVEMKEDLYELEKKIEDAKRRRDTLIARNRAAEAQRKISQTLAAAGKKNPMDILEKMEEKVERIEAEAQAYEEMGKDTLEEKFKALDEEDDVDKDLAELKKKLGK